METIQAKNKIDALKKAGYSKIYFSGNKPYSVSNSIYHYHVYAVRISEGEYFISKERQKS